MSHDFAKKGKKTKKKSKKTQPTVKPWRSFSAGLILGLVIGPLLYLSIAADKDNPTPNQQATAVTSSEKNTESNSDSNASLKKLKNQIQYEFYDLLPNQETTVEVEQEPVRDSKKANKRYSYRQAHSAKQAMPTHYAQS
ncbi:MAG: hypothetical protein KUG72_06680 [Pseudomonadales bacterium]|nr:hypothetical protein [Pseudomonadales bacterium]